MLKRVHSTKGLAWTCGPHSRAMTCGSGDVDLLVPQHAFQRPAQVFGLERLLQHRIGAVAFGMPRSP